MTPHDVNLVLEGFKLKQERENELQNTMMYIQGRYFVDALLCTVGNMFNKKGAKAIEYPKEPYPLTPPKPMTEKEKQAEVDKLFANLELMKSNFENAHNRGGN